MHHYLQRFHHILHFLIVTRKFTQNSVALTVNASKSFYFTVKEIQEEVCLQMAIHRRVHSVLCVHFNCEGDTGGGLLTDGDTVAGS